MSDVRPSNISGFSLMEVLVGLAIIALMLALTPLSLQPGAAGGETRRAAVILAAALKETRAGAIANGTEMVFPINMAKRHFGPEATAFPDNAAIAFITAGDERIGEGEAAIRFYPDGSSSGGEVRLGAGAALHTVTVDWLTGRVLRAEGDARS